MSHIHLPKSAVHQLIEHVADSKFILQTGNHLGTEQLDSRQHYPGFESNSPNGLQVPAGYHAGERGGSLEPIDDSDVVAV